MRGRPCGQPWAPGQPGQSRVRPERPPTNQPGFGQRRIVKLRHGHGAELGLGPSQEMGESEPNPLVPVADLECRVSDGPSAVTTRASPGANASPPPSRKAQPDAVQSGEGRDAHRDGPQSPRSRSQPRWTAPQPHRSSRTILSRLAGAFGVLLSQMVTADSMTPGRTDEPLVLPRHVGRHLGGRHGTSGDRRERPAGITSPPTGTGHRDLGGYLGPQTRPGPARRASTALAGPGSQPPLPR